MMQLNTGQFKKDVVHLLETEKFELIDLFLKNYKSSTLIQIYADCETGITVDDCVHLSREITKMIESKYDYFNRYRIEVSSPGLKRPLKNERDFKRNINRDVSLQFVLDDKKINMDGRIHHTTHKAVYIRHNDKIDKINYDWILSAQLKLQW